MPFQARFKNIWALGIFVPEVVIEILGNLWPPLDLEVDICFNGILKSHEMCTHHIVKHHKDLRIFASIAKSQSRLQIVPWIKQKKTVQFAEQAGSSCIQESSQAATTKSHERASACNENSLMQLKRSKVSRHLRWVNTSFGDGLKGSVPLQEL